MTSYPEIRINYAWLLNSSESKMLSDYVKRPLLSDEEALMLVERYRDAWVKHEKAILGYLHKATGLEYYRDVLDVHIAQLFVPKSEPLIISCMDDPDTFVDTLTHELIHVLLTDNNVVQLSGKHRGYLLANDWKKMFKGDHSFTTLIHIPVHALHEGVIRDYFNDESRVERDKEILKKFGSTYHLESWDYVEKTGYKKIIQQLADGYIRIHTKLKGVKS